MKVLDLLDRFLNDTESDIEGEEIPAEVSFEEWWLEKFGRPFERLQILSDARDRQLREILDTDALK